MRITSKYWVRRKSTISWINSDLKSAQINRWKEVKLRICIHGNILLHFSILNIIKELNLKLKIKKKVKLHQINSVVTANHQKEVLLSTKFVLLVNKDFTAVQTAKDRTGNKATIKNAKNFKRRWRNDDFVFWKPKIIINH